MKLVIVEDQTFIRETLSAICRRDFGHEIVGEAECAADGLRLVLATNPDAVILDLGLPDYSGLIVAVQVRSQRPAVRVLVLSGHLDHLSVFRMEKIGVHGFVDKGANGWDALRDALAAIDAGQTWFSPTYHAARRMRQTDPHTFDKVLSATEQRVLAEIGEGRNDQEIAAQLGITSTTAQTHRSHILRKLAIENTPKLVAYAIKHGFTRPGPAAPCVAEEG